MSLDKPKKLPPALNDECCEVKGCIAEPFSLRRCRHCPLLLCDAHYESRKHHGCHVEAGLDSIKYQYGARLWNVYARLSAMPLARLAWSIRQRTGPKPKVDFPSWNDIGNVHTLHKGALNVHVPIDFSDGERWACRARQQVLSRTAERVIMAHEIATSRELRTLVPEWIPDIFVPEVHQTAPADLYFVKWVSGSPVKLDHTWEPKTIEDLAQFFVRVTSKKFSGIGSLHPSPDGATIGPLMWTKTSAGLIGPFRTSQEMYLAIIDARLASVVPRPSILHYAVIPWPRLYVFLALLEFRNLVLNCDEMALEGDTFLRHGDEKGDAIRLKSDGGLDAILDWEFAYTAPLPEALAWNVFGIEAQDENFRHLLTEEFRRIHRNDLADAVAQSEKYIVLRDALMRMPPSEILKYAWTVREVFLADPGVAPTTVEEWFEVTRERFKDDPRLLAFEEAYAPYRAKEEAAIKRATAKMKERKEAMLAAQAASQNMDDSAISESGAPSAALQADTVDQGNNLSEG